MLSSFQYLPHINLHIVPSHAGAFYLSCYYYYLFILLFIYLFEQVEVLAAIQLMWSCYTHPPIYTQRTATTPGTSSPTLLE